MFIKKHITMCKKTILAVFLFTFAILLCSCHKENDETLLKEKVSELVSDIENHNILGLKKYLAKDFSTGSELNSAQFILYVRYQLKRNKNIFIRLSNTTYSFNKQIADITSDVWLLGAKDWIPERSQKYFIESRWVKENEQWVVSRLRWKISANDN